MLKKKILVAGLAVIIFVGGVLLLWVLKAEKNKDADTPVLLYPWNSSDIQYAVCYTTDEVSYSYSDSTLVQRVRFATKLSLEELIETNKEDYLGDFVFREDDGEEHQSALFYANNNYYVIFPDGEDDVKTNYRAENLAAIWCMDGFITARIYFPCPVNMSISQFNIRNASQYYGMDNYFNLLFENYTFEECKEFYEKLDSSLCLIDEEEKTITVKAYQNNDNASWGKGYLYDITINFEEKSISGPYSPQDTKTIALYGNEDFGEE